MLNNVKIQWVVLCLLLKFWSIASPKLLWERRRMRAAKDTCSRQHRMISKYRYLTSLYIGICRGSPPKVILFGGKVPCLAYEQAEQKHAHFSPRRAGWTHSGKLSACAIALPPLRGRSFLEGKVGPWHWKLSRLNALENARLSSASSVRQSKDLSVRIFLV